VQLLRRPELMSAWDSYGFRALPVTASEHNRFNFSRPDAASRGNHYGDSFRIVLPNCRVTFRVSTLWHQYLDSRDKRAMIEPAIRVPLSFADYAAGRDPVLNAALSARINDAGIPTSSR
jgi:hypothetical protein